MEWTKFIYRPTRNPHNKNAAEELYELVLDHLDADIDIDP